MIDCGAGHAGGRGGSGDCLRRVSRGGMLGVTDGWGKDQE